MVTAVAQREYRGSKIKGRGSKIKGRGSKIGVLIASSNGFSVAMDRLKVKKQYMTLCTSGGSDRMLIHRQYGSQVI